MANLFSSRHPVLIRVCGHFRPPPAVDVGIGARTVFSRSQRGLLLLGFALLVILRLPHAWVEGRFQDEEAAVFLAYAWHRPWLDALFRAFGGYWNVGANTTTLLTVLLVKGGVLPLERAPYLTMTIALAVQLLPAVLLLTGQARWLAGRAAVIAALLVIALAPATEEVFFNVLHIQFHLALCVALILALDAPARRRTRIGYGVLLFLAPLCGPGAIVILPLFALRTLVDRDARRLAQCAVFAAGAAVQLLLFYGSSPVRVHLVDPGTIVTILFVRLVALPAFGIDIANRLGTAAYESQVAGGTGWWWPVAILLLLFGLLILSAARRRDGAIWLVLSGLSIAVVSFGFGAITVNQFDLLYVGNGERYTFLPLAMVGLALVVLAMRPQSRARPVYAVICLLILVTGATGYRKPLSDFAQGPSWPAEVAAWRRDHRHPLAVWPRPFAADLSDETRPCTPRGHRVSAAGDPRYCESSWDAAFSDLRQRLR